MITMAAYISAVSCTPRAVRMMNPLPLRAPMNSATMAPTMAKLSEICRLAKIQLMAEGMMTCRVMAQGLAPRIWGVGHHRTVSLPDSPAPSRMTAWQSARR